MLIGRPEMLVDVVVVDGLAEAEIVGSQRFSSEEEIVGNFSRFGS